MAKSKTLLQSGTDKKYDKLNEGDLVFAIQCDRVDKNESQYQLMVNMDWSFDDDVTPIEIKSMLGGFLGNIEDVFGEKMVTEAIIHYAEENGHLVNTPNGGKGLHLKSKGLNFKEGWKKRN